MGDDGLELPLAEKQAIARSFIQLSPPGQTQKVVQDVITLMGDGGIDARALDEMVMRVNKKQFLPVSVPGADYSVLLTADGQLGGDGGLTFLDPQGKQALVIAHAEQRCTGVQELDAATRAECDGADRQRAEVHKAMLHYVADHLPGATLTTYGFKRGGTVKVTCCVGRCNMNLSNYWSGLWRARWTCEMAEGASTARLTGSVAAFVHYFEDGNVQLDDATTFEKTIQIGAGLAPAFAKEVGELEAGFISAMEGVYTTMSESVLNALRRRLPITKVKFDWENKAAVHKLAADLTGAKM